MDQENTNLSTCWCTSIAIIPMTVFCSYKTSKERTACEKCEFAFISNFRHFIHRLSTFESGNPIKFKSSYNECCLIPLPLVVFNQLLAI